MANCDLLASYFDPIHSSAKCNEQEGIKETICNRTLNLNRFPFSSGSSKLVVIYLGDGCKLCLVVRTGLQNCE